MVEKRAYLGSEGNISVIQGPGVWRHPWGTGGFSETGVRGPQLCGGSLPETPSGSGLLGQHLYFLLGQPVRMAVQRGEGLREHHGERVGIERLRK